TNDKGMVSRSSKKFRQTGEQTTTIVKNVRSLAMYKGFSTNNLTAKCLRDHLMTQTNTQNRDPALETFDHSKTDSGIIRRTWSRGNQQMIRRQFIDAFKINLIVTFDDDLLVQFPQILYKVICEGIIVVNHQNQLAPPPSDGWLFGRGSRDTSLCLRASGCAPSFGCASDRSDRYSASFR